MFKQNLLSTLTSVCDDFCLGCRWMSGIDKQEKTDVHYRSVISTH